MRMRLQLGMLLILLWVGCGREPDSQTNTSLVARHFMGSPREFQQTNIDSLDVARLDEDWAYRRRVSWALWSELLELQAINATDRLYKFQTWYSFDDLQRIFSYLWRQQSEQQADASPSFNPEMILQAEIWHLQSLWQYPHWTPERYDEWVNSHSTSAEMFSLPGIERILFNRHYLHHILKHYRDIVDCSSTQAHCLPQFPVGAAIIKTAWQRYGHGFEIPFFLLNNQTVKQVFANQSWIADGDREPENIIHMETKQGSRFYLTAMHLSLKTDEHWLWSSIWWDPERSPLAEDRPDSLASNYQMCAVSDYKSSTANIDGMEFPALQTFLTSVHERFSTSSWCSNPYIEHGTNNHKTNCIACHQYAGDIQHSESLVMRLTNDLDSLQQQQRSVFKTDYAYTPNFGGKNFKMIFSRTLPAKHGH